MIYIKNIKFNNFRCFSSKMFNFSPNINILTGNNGCGKTSVVEGISYLCLGKSFRGAKDKDVLMFNSVYFNIISDIEQENTLERVVISYDGVNKRVKQGEIVYKTLSEYVGKYKLISFSPDDLDVIKGTPSIRRRFIDLFISQCDNNYLKVLVEYKKVLKMRNEFLKNIVNQQYDKILFDVLNENIIKYGKLIINIRAKYINLLNLYIKNISNELSNNKETVNISYNPNVNEDYYEKMIINNINLDINTHITNYGPHRDDYIIDIFDKDASVYASQGQCRLAVLSVKLSMYEAFLKNNSNIIIVLDDVFSELDTNRQKYLLEYINKTGQVFITTTDIDKLPKDLVDNSNIIEIREGECNG